MVMKSTILFATLSFLSLSLFGQTDSEYFDQNLGKAPPMGEFFNHKTIPETSHKTLAASIQLDSIIEVERDDNDNIVNYRKDIYYYDASGNVVQEELHIWDSISWRKHSKDVYTFNNNSLPVLWVSYDGENGVWVTDRMAEYTYNSNKQLVEAIYSEADSSVWSFSSKYEYDYDAAGNTILEMYSSYGNGMWENQEKNEAVYNAANLLVMYTRSEWENGQWEYYSRSTTTYSASNVEISYLSQLWNNGAWENDWKRENMYDANDNDTLQLKFSWDGNAWENDRRFTQTFDSDNNLTTRTDEYWSSNAWVKLYKWEYIYDLDNLLNEMYFYNALAGQWKYSSHYNYQYDSGNNLISQVRAYWNNYSWIVTEKRTWKYDLTYSLTDIWLPNGYYEVAKLDAKHNLDYDNGTWKIDDTTAYYYSAIPFSVEEYAVEHLKVYPNPTNGKLIIETNSTLEKEIEIFDLMGNRVMKFNTQNMLLEFSLMNFPGGIYVIKISQTNRITVNRVIKY